MENLNEQTKDLMAKFVMNATARIQQLSPGKYSYEIVIGFLSMDDVLRFDSKEYSNIAFCLSDLQLNFHKHIKKLIQDKWDGHTSVHVLERLVP